MSNQHFHYFRVKNFKRFKDLEIENIGQFNLVLGDNNVGKTSLLEALMFNENFKVLESHMFSVLSYRNLGKFNPKDTFKYFLDKEYITSKNQVITFQTDRSYEYRFSFAFDQHGDHGFADMLHSNKRETLWQNPVFTAPPFIPFGGSHSEDLVSLYSNHIQFNREQKRKLIQALKTLYPDIEDIEISVLSEGASILICHFSNSNIAAPLASIGEGYVKLFRILVEIIDFQSGRLMIDEIDAGVHYSRMKDYWKVILQAGHENEVQIFATTHNRECIQCFIEALEELGKGYQIRARAIKLVEHAQTKEVLAFTKPFEKIEEDLAVGNEVR